MEQILKPNKALTNFLWILRLVVGILFILSGYSKLIDPHGLEYKMEEFFEVLHLNFLAPYSLTFSLLMNAFEIIAGFALLIGYRFRTFSFLLLLLIIFFTFLTAYANFSGKIKECGCFGNCIKITADQSFYKDVILLILISIIFFFRKRIAQFYSNNLSNLIMIVVAFLAFYMQYWVLQHGPFIDCSAYKIGNNIPEKMKMPAGALPDSFVTKLVYEKNGKKEVVDVTSPILSDSTWHFVDQQNTLVRPATGKIEITDFNLQNFDRQDVTNSVLDYPGYVGLYFIKDIDKASTENIDKLKSFIADAKKANIIILGATTADDIASNKFKTKTGVDITFNTIDGVVCKTAMRANSGIIILKNGTITHKFTFNDYPTFANLGIKN